MFHRLADDNLDVALDVMFWSYHSTRLHILGKARHLAVLHRQLEKLDGTTVEYELFHAVAAKNFDLLPDILGSALRLAEKAPLISA